MAYQDAVAEAASALTRGEDANWELARLTWENTKGTGDSGSQHDKVTMDQWCADLRATSRRRFSVSHGRLFKRIWEQFGRSDLDERPPWTEALYEIKPEASYESVAERRDIARSLASIAVSTPEVKRDLAAKLLTDPAVADAVLDQPAARRAVYDSLQRQEQRAEVKHQTMRAADPVGQRLDREAALIDLEKTLRRFADDARTLTVAIGALPERSDGAIAPHLFLRQSFVAAEDALGSLRTLLETGVSDLDNFLDGVLKGAS